MNTTERGNAGEEQAAEYLQSHKYEIIARNWKTRMCEIDIIAKRKKRIYFVEVKTRQSTRFGSGIEYVTAKKLQQMRFAAELWVHEHNWNGEYQLAVISIDAGELSFIDAI